MKALLTDQGTAAGETFLCGTCFYGPDGLSNQAYARKQAHSYDVNPDSEFEDCTGNEAASCCVCGVYEMLED